jgi:hypothetical protein
MAFPELARAAAPERHSHRRRVAAALVIAVMMSGTASGCGRAGWELFGHAVGAIAYVAVTAMVLAAHDHHYHGAYCGHTYVVYEQHPVYYYDGRWEYYDPSAGSWYYYPDGIDGY